MRPATDDSDRLSPTATTGALAHAIADGVHVLDARGRLVTMNPAAEQILGWRERELEGRDLHDAVHFQDGAGRPMPREACAIQHALRTGEAVRREDDWFTRKDGTVVAVAYTASAVVEDGAVLGVVVVFRDVTEQRAEEAGRIRAAAEREEIVRAMQTSLLPDLPEVSGLELAVSFRPVGSQVLVGGDFYDVFACDGGHMVLIGDVCGKGPETAAVGGMIRYLLRGACRETQDLARVLSLVNAELLTHPAQRFATVVLAFIGPPEDGVRRVTVAAAGHPRPVRLGADGGARSVGGAGQLLGVVTEPRVVTDEVELAEGDALVCFTDGLTELGARTGAGELDVAATLEGLEGRTAAEALTRLEDAGGVLTHAQLPDDVAILAVRAVAEPGLPPRAVHAPSGEVPAEPAVVGEIEAGFREVNERVAQGRPGHDDALGIVCECGHVHCREVIDVPRDAYDAIRDDDRSFVIAPGHQVGAAEQVVERRASYWIVRKWGDAGEVAEARAGD